MALQGLQLVQERCGSAVLAEVVGYVAALCASSSSIYFTHVFIWVR